jgi:RNA polymerase-interacting CarD/CdnL/TRCF family regulator
MSILQKTRFSVGDWIVHNKFGVGKVEDIVEKGVDKDRQTFYKILTNKITYWLPLDNENCDYIEPIRSKQDFKNALKILSQSPEPIDTSIRSRKNIVRERWLDGSLNGRASLIRDLNHRNRLQKLNYKEKELLHRIRQSFLNEWLLSDRSMTQQKAQEGLESALKVSVSKA